MYIWEYVLIQFFKKSLNVMSFLKNLLQTLNISWWSFSRIHHPSLLWAPFNSAFFPSRISLGTSSSWACFLYFWREWSFWHLLSVKSPEDKKVALSFPAAWLTVFLWSQSKVVGTEELPYHKSVWGKNSLYIFVFVIKSLKLPDDKWAP